MTPLRDSGARSIAALAAVGFLAILSSLARVNDVPAVALVALVALVILAALRPDQALTVLAMGTPVAAWLGRQWNPSPAWAETLVVAFCAGYCLRGIWRARDTPDGRSDLLGPPLFLAVAVVLASLAVRLLSDAWRFGNAALLNDVRDLVASGYYFVMPASGDPIDAAMRLLESFVIFRAAASATRRSPALGLRLVAWTACGAAAAAALNLLRLWEAARRLEFPVSAFAGLLMTQRINVHYGDLNAAGSYFVMACLASIGLALTTGRKRWFAAAALIATSIWITGSRTAIMAGLIAAVVPAIALLRRIPAGRARVATVAAAGVALALLAASAAYTLPERGNQQAPETAARVRWELAKTSLRMASSSPSFGVGVGGYYERSGEFSSPELLRIFPPAVHENAHNNFLQILAELGIVGFAAIVWLLGAAVLLCLRVLRASPDDPLKWGVLTGLLAFVLSWLGGHPLLIDEPAFAFWLLLGAASGWGLSTSPHPSARPRGWMLAALAVALAISVPLRTHGDRGNFDLAHRGVGLSVWQDALDGVRYRLAGSTSSVFVPSDAQVIVVPLRSVEGVPELRVWLSLDGRPADVVSLVPDRWQHLRLRMPQDRDAPRFRRLELRAERPSAGASPVLMIGKVEPR
jgi:O-antigen ligase